MNLRSIDFPLNSSNPIITCGEICGIDNYSNLDNVEVLTIKKLIKEDCEFNDGDLVAVQDVKCNKYYEEYFAFKYRGRCWTYVNGKNYGVWSWKFCDHIKSKS